jgi:2-hydroxy-3-keto-5-methylthiopentenyl-1-phosphate phosphatase
MGAIAGLPTAMRVICDFDGTITRQDSTDLVLEALAAPDWRRLQDEWLAGRLSGAECMRGQVALIGGSDAELDAVLDQVQMDPGFSGFVDWCEARGVALSVVSDGVDYFIGRILARHGLQRLSRVANRLAGAPGARRLEQPWLRPDCAAGSGVCKCAAVLADLPAGGTSIFVGDGRSDYCIADRADILFAKGALADRASDRNQAYLPFETFDDVRRTLAVLMGEHLAAPTAPHSKLSGAC